MRAEASEQRHHARHRPEWDSPEFSRLMRIIAAGRVKFISHAGKKILLTDLSATRGEQSIAVISEMMRVTALHAPGTVLMLTDVTDWVFDKQLLAIAAESARRNAPYVKKCAVVGATGLRRIAFESIVRESARKNLKCVDTRRDALNWLVMPYQ